MVFDPVKLSRPDQARIRTMLLDPAVPLARVAEVLARLGITATEAELSEDRRRIIACAEVPADPEPPATGRRRGAAASRVWRDLDQGRL